MNEKIVNLTGLSREERINYWLMQLQEGKIIIGNGARASVILRRNEKFQFSLFNMILLEPCSISRGGYAGPSIRLFKGLYFRIGGWQAKSHEEIRKIDCGTLIVTNKRLIFSGSKRISEVDLKKIISIEPCDNGIVLRRHNKTKVQYFVGVNQTELTVIINDKKHKDVLSGSLLTCLIEGLAK